MSEENKEELENKNKEEETVNKEEEVNKNKEEENKEVSFDFDVESFSKALEGDEEAEKLTNLAKKYSKDGKVSAVEITKALREAQKKISEGKPKAPEKYEIEVEEFKGEDNNYVNSFLEQAKELGLSNEQVNNFLKKQSEIVAENQNKLAEELGGRENIKKTANQLAKFIDEESAQQLFSVVVNKESFEAINKIVEKLSKSIDVDNSDSTDTDQISDLETKIEEIQEKLLSEETPRIEIEKLLKQKKDLVEKFKSLKS